MHDIQEDEQLQQLQLDADSGAVAVECLIIVF
jgi:hypothetical protein